MDLNWTLIFTTNQVSQAELIKRTLSNNEIEAVVLNKKNSSYNIFGELEVYVKDIDKEVALTLIKDFKN